MNIARIALVLIVVSSSVGGGGCVATNPVMGPAELPPPSYSLAGQWGPNKGQVAEEQEAPELDPWDKTQRAMWRWQSGTDVVPNVDVMEIQGLSR